MKNNIFILTMLCSLLVISCMNKKETTKEKEVLPPNIVEMNDDQVKMAGIEIGKVGNKVISNDLKVNGIVNVVPQNLVSVSVNMGGFVKSTDLTPGSPVKKGQVLAIIENSDFIELQQNYLEYKNRLEYAEADYNRQKDLYNENVSSAKNYQLALSEFKILKSKVFALEQKLALIGIVAKELKEDKISRSVTVVSPIDGYIKAVNVNIGKYVNSTDVMFEIINNQKLILELSLFEKDIDKVTIGQKIKFSLPDKPSKEQTAVIYQVGKTISEENTVKIFAFIDNENINLLPGMYVNAIIETSDKSSTSLPDEAVLTFEDKNYIFIYKGRRKEDKKEVTDFLMVEVKKGNSNRGFTEIILPQNFDIEQSGVVIKGAYNLLSALKNGGEMAC
jgi:membrane fusion protein, heavy metal efflux system